MDKQKYTGFTFLEAIIALLIFAISVISLFACLSLVSKTTENAKLEINSNMHVTKIIELINQYPYSRVTTNYFPIEYVTDNSGNLVYALTTTITEVTSPTIYKKIKIDYTWSNGDMQHHTRYYYVKPK